jgi:hypothetical protein
MISQMKSRLAYKISPILRGSLIAVHAPDGAEENHFYELNSTINVERISDFNLWHLGKKTFVFLHGFTHYPTDRCFLYADYGNPNTRYH